MVAQRRVRLLIPEERLQPGPPLAPGVVRQQGEVEYAATRVVKIQASPSLSKLQSPRL